MSGKKNTFSIAPPSEMKKLSKNMKPNTEGPLSKEKVAKLILGLDWLEAKMMTDRFQHAVMRAMNDTNPHHSHEQAVLLAYSAQRRQGENYNMHAFVKYDPTNTDEPFQFTNMRPEKHEKHIWYFDLVYLILGGELKKMGTRSLNHPDNIKLGLKPIITRLRENEQLKENGYVVSLQAIKNRETKVMEKWILKVHWGEDKDRVEKFRLEKNKTPEVKSSPKAKANPVTPPKAEDFSATLEDSKQKAKPKITPKKE
jgi:hypothetical protein